MNVFWFRRDLRLYDNHALFRSLKNGTTLPIFIFDSNIIDNLEKNDARVSFIYETLQTIDNQLKKYSSGLKIYFGKPFEVFKEIIDEFEPESIYLNEDYEPYAINRDSEIEKLAIEKNIGFYKFKDQVIFEKKDILKADGKPFQVFTAYKNKWLSLFHGTEVYESESLLDNTLKSNQFFPSLESNGFKKSDIKVKSYSFVGLDDYQDVRDFPAIDKTSYASVHLRFGTLSVRHAVKEALKVNSILLNELIWREFFMQILYHFPNVVTESFNPAYRKIEWINDEINFIKWKQGITGYPIVDAGMRQFDQTGYMHNRVRMITAGFLTKHLLIDWRWGESYFAEKLLDFELSSNNGNWQWAAGTGCDAAPYFRIFNPVTQQEKFDKNFEYIKTWVPEYGTSDYPVPIIDHKVARERALKVFSKSIIK
jgi:deoxyribodipyrimidine photo-lyase